MSLSDLTPTQLQLQQQHIERRLRIASQAVFDQPINLKFKNGIIPILQISYPQGILCGKLWASLEPWGCMPKYSVRSRDWTLLKNSDKLKRIPPNFIHRIQRIVSAEFEISLNDILSDRRTANLIIPRHVAMHLAMELTLKSMPEIGRRFSNRHHTTVMHAARKTQARMIADSWLCQTVVGLQERLMQDISDWQLKKLR